MAEDAKPYIITIASPKGGAGKTMTTILLAGEFAAGGMKVLIIDTDPQLAATQWYEQGKKAGYALKNIDLVSITDVKKLAAKLDKPGQYEVVLVDIQGSAAAALGSAVGYADFVIIPMRASAFDVNGAIGMVSELRQGRDGRQIPFGIMLNSVAGIDSRTMAFKLAMQRLEAANLKILDVYLSKRPTFDLVAFGGTLYETEGEDKAIREARDQTNALAAEIIGLINEQVGEVA